ncbi:hypothetical protein BsWGS_01825 [Bradybaena similaris]
MFRSRTNDKGHPGDTGVNREVSVPLVKTQDGKDFDPKRKPSTQSTTSRPEQGLEEVYFLCSRVDGFD